MKTVRFEQTSEYKGPEWWHWEIWVDEPTSVLRSIKSVEYTLHRTFPDPVRTATSWKDQFKLKTAGWGVFRIFIRVFWADGEVTEHHHDLALASPSRPSRPRIFLSFSQAERDIAEQLMHLADAEGIELVEAGSTGSAYVATLEHAMKKADALVLIVGGPLSPWMEEELAMAERQHLPVLKVLVGPQGRENDPLPDLVGIKWHADFASRPARMVQNAAFLKALRATLGEVS